VTVADWRTAGGPRAIALVLAIFAIVFVALEVGSYTQKAATWDEPVHMADGYASLVQHDYRIDPEHPPFLRMWAALPLLMMTVTPFDLSDVDKTPPRSWAWTLYSFCGKFLYVSNDADRLLYASRFMTVLLGLALGVMLFSWAREWLGFWPAVAALAFYTVEPNIAAHASLVTTDVGLACFMFGTLYFLWRTCRRVTVLNVAGLSVFFALAIVSKFSALVLIPGVALILGGAAIRQSALTPARAIALFAFIGLFAWLAVWGVYGFRYAPSASGTWLYEFQSDQMVRGRVPALASLIGWVDVHHLVPNVFSQGLLFGQAKAQVRPAFLFGSFSNQGWWYYFPLAFLVKTPVAILLFITAGLVAVARDWRRLGPGTLAVILIPAGLYLGAAMAARINIGLRHILLIYPIALLVGAAGAKGLLTLGGNRGVVMLGSLLVVGGLEFGSVYPDNLAFFNALVGGASKGSQYLVDSNLDWGQDLKTLKRWMDVHNVPHINLAYFGSAFPPYYGINATPLPGSAFYETAPEVEIPGYVAVSATLLNGVYLGEQERAFYRAFQTMVPVATIGHSIYVFKVDKPWW
jgi:hypothetical protein